MFVLSNKGSYIKLIISFYLDDEDTLDDVDIEDDVETELDVDALEKQRKIITDFIFLRSLFKRLIFFRNLKSCFNDNQINSILSSHSWILEGIIKTHKMRYYEINCYLDEVDTLDDVDTDDDVDTELEEETLKKKNQLSSYSKRYRIFLVGCELKK